TPADYGAAEVLITGVIAASIVIRLGVIEALLRFYYQADEVPDQVVKTAFASLFWTTTIGLALALPFAGPISHLLLGHTDAGLMLRGGLPTMPAELSLYSLNFIDRVLIVRLVGLGDAGLYSLSVKFAQAVNVLVKGFQLAWPPLAYSIQDDDEARRAYAVIVTWFVSAATFVVAGMWLLSRWIVRALAAPEFFGSYKTIGLVSTGVMLYALYLVLVIVLGRTGRTEFNFPATGAGTVVNIGLNLLLLPSMGIVGAGVSLVASYAVVLVLMYVFTQRLFKVRYEWLRLGQAAGLAIVLVLAGE